MGKTRWPDASTGASSASEQETVLVNALGQPLVTTDRNGNSHTLAYDILGRVVSDTVTTLGSGVDGSVRRVETAYDSQSNAYLSTTYDAVTGGNIVTQVQRAYNSLGQLTTEYQSHGGAVNTGTTPKVQYTYSTLDSSNRSRPTSIVYPNGRTVGYNYSTRINDAVSRLSSLSDSAVTLEGYQYLGAGTVVSRTHPEMGVDTTYIKRSGESNTDAGDQYIGLDRFGRVIDQRSVNASTGVATDRFGYTYDRNGNRLTMTNNVNSSYSEVYTYDGLNQLSSSNRGSGTRTQSWDYDALGNWNSVTTNGTAQTRSANKQNEYTSISGATTPTYDANGNMTGNETGKTFVYDAWNRLKQVMSGSSILMTYTYDGLNRRVVENNGTARDLYYSKDWQLLEERTGSTVVASYVWSNVYIDAMVARDRPNLGDRKYVQQDANFNVTAILSTSGVVLERYVQDAFGSQTILSPTWSVLSSSGYGWVHGHQGGRFSAESGFYYFRMRDYSPTMGRWDSMDPIEYKAGDANLYSYLFNGPHTALDPNGTDRYVIGGKVSGCPLDHSRIAVDLWIPSPLGFIKLGIITFSVGQSSWGKSVLVGNLWNLWCATGIGANHCDIDIDFYLNRSRTPMLSYIITKPIEVRKSDPLADILMLLMLAKDAKSGTWFNGVFNNCHMWVWRRAEYGMCMDKAWQQKRIQEQKEQEASNKKWREDYQKYVEMQREYDRKGFGKGAKFK